MAKEKKRKTIAGNATRERMGQVQINIALTQKERDLINQAAGICGMSQREYATKRLVAAAHLDIGEFVGEQVKKQNKSGRSLDS